jgi:hypothetical protein
MNTPHQKNNRIKAINMKKIIIALLVIPCISATLVFSIYESLKISQSDAKKLLLQSIGRCYVADDDHNVISGAKKLSTEEKVEGVKELIQLAKEYTASDQFKSDYKKWRNEQLNPGTKSKLGIPKFGKMLENKIDNTVDKKENEKKYPADGMELVKKRLADFLRISATVDFDAKLDGGNAFVNPEYEKKSSEWKMCYRAGKDVVEAARVEAQKWLDELDAK